MRRSSALALVTTLAGCGLLHTGGPSAPSREGRRDLAAFRRSVDSLLVAPVFRNAIWGILVVDAQRGETLYSHMPATLLLPASNMKLATGSTALEQLGPDYRFRTFVLARGSVDGGTLIGDLVVSGRGDPTISDHMRGDAMIPMRAIAESLSAHGVHRVTGRIVAGDDVFPGAVRGYGWPWDQLDDSDFAGVDELLFNEGFSTVRVYGGAHAGDRVRVVTAPARTYPPLHVDAVTVDGAPPPAGGGPRERPEGVQVHYDTVSGALDVSGWIEAGDSVATTVAQHDPDSAFLAALGEAVRDAGIVVEGTAALPAAHADTLFVLTSAPLREILPALMKPSQNQIAEALLRTVGLEKAGVGSPDSGRKVIERQLAAFGATPDGFVVHDGSGLSRYDYLSPETIVLILDGMRRSPNFELFYESLPIAGVDGTLRGRMHGTPAEGNVHAKTGTLTGARSLSGYVRSADRQLLEFSILCNNWTVPVSEVNRVQDAIAVALAQLHVR